MHSSCAIMNGVYELFFFFKQETAYERRISDWSSTCALPISVSDGVGVQVEQGVGLAVEVEHDHPAVDAQVARQRQHGGRAQARGGIALRNMQDRKSVA